MATQVAEKRTTMTKTLEGAEKLEEAYTKINQLKVELEESKRELQRVGKTLLGGSSRKTLQVNDTIFTLTRGPKGAVNVNRIPLD